jgi:DNA-binding CsgD family transcriptional regulator
MGRGTAQTTAPEASQRRTLLGRDQEREQLLALVASARDGKSGVLVLRGEPGIGKTALLEEVAAESDGAALLRATGVGSETELAFSGLSALLEPLTERIEGLPPPQAAALAGALGIGPAVPGDPLTVAAATLSLLALGAEDAGLVSIVDDAHWIDSASLQSLAFAARRLRAEGVALLFAVREGEVSLLDEAGLPELVLEGLPDASARELLVQDAPTLAPKVAETVLQTAEGNPLALIELPRALSVEEAAGQTPIVEPLRAGASLERALLRQLDRLPDRAHRALLVAACAEPEESQALARALPIAGAAWADLESAESAEIVSLEGSIRFRHPLLRSVLYHAAPAAQRRAAHRALADGLSPAGAPERVAWHRALAQASPDEEAAAALADAGTEARLRNAPDAAARAFERAAELTPSPEMRARRLFTAGESLVLAGQAERAVELLERALSDADEPELRLEIQHLHARTLVGAGRGGEAHALLAGEATKIEGTDPGRAALLHAEASYGSLVSGQPRAALASAERAFALAQDVGGEPLIAATLALAYGLIDVGEVQRGSEALDAGLRALEQADPLMVWQPLMAAASFVSFLGREEESWEICTRLVSALRSASAPGLLSLPLATLCHLEWRLGHWQEARATGTEAVELSHSAGLAGFWAFALTGLARLAGSQGRAEECRELGTEALRSSNRTGVEGAIPYALGALVLGALGEGNLDEAVVQGAEMARFYYEHGYRSPGSFQWHGDVIEAYFLAGRREEAHRLLESFSEEAKATTHPWGLPVAARCRGLLDDEGMFEDAFAEGLRLHVGQPFERARTELALGERRRRARRRAEARAPLQSALATFEALGAEPWADRARKELQATGARPRRRAPGPTDELTPHELHVAQVVARGATNREAAAELFLSPKTIDFHLRNVYRKLGVRSRTELANRMRPVAQESA